MSVPHPLPVHRLDRNIRGIDRVVFKRDLKTELSSLVNPSALQHNAILRSVLGKHPPVTKHKLSD